MLIDHIGMVFFPNAIILRCIGRIAFPLFFYSTFIGYFKTKNIKKYIIRLLILAIISEPIYILLLDKIEINICFSLMIELLILYLLDKKMYLEYILLFTISLIFIPITSYLLFILFLTPIFFYTRNTKWLFSISYILFIVLMVILGYSKIYLLCLLALPLFIIKIDYKININKYFFYAFYPVHLLVLYAIKLLF
jgi:hypothetical protein